MRSMVFVGWCCVLASCGGESESAQVTEPAAPAPVASAKEVPPPTPPREPSAAELAEAALAEGRYADVCNYLVAHGFSEPVCTWLLDTISASGDRTLTTDRFQGFLRAQQVRRISGTIVGWYDEARNEYEARING